MSEFEKKVRIALIKKDMKMIDLANELDISTSYLHDLLKNKRNSEKIIKRIKEILELGD